MGRGNYSGGSAIHQIGSGWFSKPFRRSTAEEKKRLQKKARKKRASLERWAANLEDGWTQKLPGNARKSGVDQKKKVNATKRRRPLSLSYNPEVSAKYLHQQEKRMEKVEIIYKRRKRRT